MDIEFKHNISYKKNRPLFKNGYNKNGKIKMRCKKNYIKIDKKIIKIEFRYGNFILTF